MIRAALSRMAAFLGTLFGATAFVLVLLVSAPGDPVDLIPNGEAIRPQLEAEWGLTRPLHVRYAMYLGRALTLDFGTSIAYRPGQPVMEVISGPAQVTVGLVLGALACATVWGLALALLTAGRRQTKRRTLGGWAIQAVSIVPVFLLAHGLVLAINETTWALVQADAIARPTWFALPDQPSALRTALAIAVLAVGSGALTEAHSQIEDAVTHIRRSPYLDAVRARGHATWPHVALNLLPSLAATVAERAAYLAGGAVIVEKVLLLNGVGAVMWQAAVFRDYDLALAIALLAAAFVGAIRLLSDTVRLAVDPRLREAA